MTSTDMIETRVHPAGLWDWTVNPDLGGHRVTGSERYVIETADDDITPLVFGTGPTTVDGPPHGWLHRKPTEAEDALPRPDGYPLPRWADPDVKGTQWPLIVAPELREQYTEADQHITHADEPGYQIDVAPGALWPAMSVRVAEALPGAFEPAGTTQGFGGGEYRTYRQTPALLDHHARLRWIGDEQWRADTALITCTCGICGTRWQELPAYRTTVCANCQAAFTIARQPGMLHLLDHLPAIRSAMR